MTRASATHPWNNPTTLALYTATLKPISDMMRSVLTQTSDTGQVNWTTITTVPATATVRDYEVFRLTDSLQGSAPVFLRIDWMYSSTTTSCRIDWSVGTGTDGAGNLTGVTVTRGTANNTLINYGWNGAGPFTSYASTDGSQIVLVFNLYPGGSTADNYSALVVERFRNADGSPNGEGYNAWSWQNNAPVAATFVGYARVLALGTQSGVEYQPPVLIPQLVFTTTGTTLSGTTDYGWPLMTNGAAILRGPSQAVAYGLKVDYPRDAEINVPYTGTTKKFLALGSSAQLGMPYYSSSNNGMAYTTVFTPLFRWE